LNRQSRRIRAQRQLFGHLGLGRQLDVYRLIISKVAWWYGYAGSFQQGNIKDELKNEEKRI